MQNFGEVNRAYPLRDQLLDDTEGGIGQLLDVMRRDQGRLDALRGQGRDQFDDQHLYQGRDQFDDQGQGQLGDPQGQGRLGQLLDVMRDQGQDQLDDPQGHLAPHINKDDQRYVFEVFKGKGKK